MKKITQKQIDYIINSYVSNRKSTYDIANDLGISRVTVGKYLRENNIKISHQKYKFDEEYFKEIDTSNKAYFLGLIYADGSIFNNNCKIKLVETDGYILESFKKEVESTKPLNYRKAEIITGTSYMGKPQLSIELCSKILIEDLKKWGVYQNKSLTLKFPDNLPEKFMSHFIRGYFDGDGCIYNSQGRIMLNFTGSEYFCKGLCSWLENNLNIKTKCKQDKRGKSWYLYILRITDVLKFCNYIYQNEQELKLFRKFKKFKDYECKNEKYME